MENIADMVKLSEASLSGYMQSADEKKKQLLTIRDEKKRNPLKTVGIQRKQ